MENSTQQSPRPFGSSCQAVFAAGTDHELKSSINILTQTGSTMSFQTVSHPRTVLNKFLEHHLRWGRLVLNPRVSKILSAQRNRFLQTHGRILTKIDQYWAFLSCYRRSPRFSVWMGTGIVVHPTWQSHWLGPSCQVWSLIRVSPTETVSPKSRNVFPKNVIQARDILAPNPWRALEPIWPPSFKPKQHTRDQNGGGE